MKNLYCPICNKILQTEDFLDECLYMCPTQWKHPSYYGGTTHYEKSPTAEMIYIDEFFILNNFNKNITRIKYAFTNNVICEFSPVISINFLKEKLNNLKEFM